MGLWEKRCVRIAIFQVRCRRLCPNFGSIDVDGIAPIPPQSPLTCFPPRLSVRSALTRPPLRLTNRNDPCTSDICHVAAFDTPPHLPLFNPTFGRALSYLHFFFLLSRLSFCSPHKVCSSQALIHVSIHPSSPEWTVGESPSWATVALAKQRLPYKYVFLPPVTPCYSSLFSP